MLPHPTRKAHYRINYSKSLSPFFVSKTTATGYSKSHILYLFPISLLIFFPTICSYNALLVGLSTVNHEEYCIVFLVLYFTSLIEEKKKIYIVAKSTKNLMITHLIQETSHLVKYLEVILVSLTCYYMFVVLKAFCCMKIM